MKRRRGGLYVETVMFSPRARASACSWVISMVGTSNLLELMGRSLAKLRRSCKPMLPAVKLGGRVEPRLARRADPPASRAVAELGDPRAPGAPRTFDVVLHLGPLRRALTG